MESGNLRPRFDLSRRAVRIVIYLCSAAGLISTYLFLTNRFEPQIHAFLHSLRLYVMILSPVFVIMAIYLFTEDKWSTISDPPMPAQK